MRMQILTIGSDRNLFKKDSDAQKRIRDYGKLFSELRIIVFADKNLGFSDLKLDENIFIYPTNHKYKFFYLFSLYKIVRKISSASGPILTVTTQDPFESGLAGWLLKLWLKIPLQIQIHTDIFSPYFSAESFVNKLRVFLAKFLLPRADGIRVVSERIRQSLQSESLKLKADPIVLPVFVDVKKIQSAKIKINLHEKYPNRDFIILMASRLTREKNIGMAIDAFASAKGQMLNIKSPLLLIVGDGPEKENLQFKITNYQLQNNVIIESSVDSSTLFSYYKTADLFLSTSNYEGYGRTLIEAMACGLPVVTTDVGLVGEILVKDLDGMVFAVGDASGLGSILSDLAANPEKRAEFGVNSMKLVENFPSKEDYLERYKNSLMMLK